MDQTRPGVIEDSIFKTLDCSLSLTSSIGKYYDLQNHSLFSFAFLLEHTFLFAEVDEPFDGSSPKSLASTSISASTSSDRLVDKSFSVVLLSVISLSISSEVIFPSMGAKENYL